ncbi:flagellin, partial [Gammaproteobacteria bacterium]|nr:flagellin [Gammaproteobacteria bacterium]
IASRMTSQVSTLDMAARNANDGVSMVQTAEGASKEITNMLVRMKELAVQSASGTYSDTDRAALDLEFGALMSEIDRVAKNTTWNTNTVLNGGDATPVYSASVTSTALDIRLGSASTDKLTVTFKSWVPSSAIDAGTTDAAGAGTNVSDNTSTSAFGDAVLQWGTANNNVGTRIDITAADHATYAITQLDKAIKGATSEQANYGAFINRLQHAADNLANVSANTDQSRSRIQDADYAVETTNLARTQIIAQASTAMLAQANQSKQSVLALLQ